MITLCIWPIMQYPGHPVVQKLHHSFFSTTSTPCLFLHSKNSIFQMWRSIGEDLIDWTEPVHAGFCRQSSWGMAIHIYIVLFNLNYHTIFDYMYTLKFRFKKLKLKNNRHSLPNLLKEVHPEFSSPRSVFTFLVNSNTAIILMEQPSCRN